MSERIVVSLTTYKRRINNIPAVLDSIFSQSLEPDLVVINLAINEIIPEGVYNYIESHAIEINRVPDTKVYKKLIPTLKKYPSDCVIAIDDDFLYPKDMIETFITMHKQYPDFPISGNREAYFGMQCHCGCASLTKAEFLGPYLDSFNDDLIKKCPSDDIAYTYFSNKTRHPYIRTNKLFFNNMPSYNEGTCYSKSIGDGALYKSYTYLVSHWGDVPINFLLYDEDLRLPIIEDIVVSYKRMGREEERATVSYKLGNCLMRPFKSIRRFFVCS